MEETKLKWDIFFIGPEKFDEHISVESANSESMNEARALVIETLEKIGATPKFGKNATGPRDPMVTAAADSGISKVCGRCGGSMKFKSGVNKSGKEYKGYFCQSNREHVEWEPRN